MCTMTSITFPTPFRTAFQLPLSRHSTKIPRHGYPFVTAHENSTDLTQPAQHNTYMTRYLNLSGRIASTPETFLAQHLLQA